MNFDCDDQRFESMYTKKGLVESYRSKTMRFFENEVDVTENLPPAFLAKFNTAEGMIWGLYLDNRTELLSRCCGHSGVFKDKQIRLILWLGRCDNTPLYEAVLITKIYLNQTRIRNCDSEELSFEKDDYASRLENHLENKLYCSDLQTLRDSTYARTQRDYRDYDIFVLDNLSRCVEIEIGGKYLQRPGVFDIDLYESITWLDNDYNANLLYLDFLKMEEISRFRGLSTHHKDFYINSVYLLSKTDLKARDIKAQFLDGGIGQGSPPAVNGKDQVLYRMYSVRGDLLYVGISSNAQKRFRQHFGKQPWAKEVYNIRVEFFPCRESVETAEREAIRREKPKYNVVHAR